MATVPSVKKPSIELSENEWLKVRQGCASGATYVERSESRELLKRIGFEHRPKAKRKPGPKVATNPTEDEIALRIRLLRLILGEGHEKSSVDDVLEACAEAVSRFDEMCGQGFFVTESDRSHLFCLSSLARTETSTTADLPRQYPPLRGPETSDLSGAALGEWLKEFHDEISESANLRWDAFAKRPSQRKVRRPSKRAVWKKLAVAVNLQTKDKLLKPFYPEASVRNEILRTSITRLLDIKSIVSTCRHIAWDERWQTLYEFSGQFDLRDAHLTSWEWLDSLEVFFQSVLGRQIRKPFPPYTNEAHRLGPEDLPEGAVLHLHETKGASECTVENVRVICGRAGEDGLPRKDVVGELKRTFCLSRAAAYRVINKALACNVIIWTSHKRLVAVPRKTPRVSRDSVRSQATVAAKPKERSVPAKRAPRKGSP